MSKKKGVQLTDGRTMTVEEFLKTLEEPPRSPQDHPRTLGELMTQCQGEESSKQVERKMRNTANHKDGEALELDIVREAQRSLPHVDLIHIPARFKTWQVHPVPGQPRHPRSVLSRLMRQEWPDIRSLFIARPSSSTWVDFVGLWKGGSAHFDTKHTRTRSNSWTFGNQVEKHQMQILRRQHTLGNASFIYLRHNLPQRGHNDYIIPVLEDGLPFENSHQVQWGVLEKWRLPNGKTWFDAACRWGDYLNGGWDGLSQLEEDEP